GPEGRRAPLVPPRVPRGPGRPRPDLPAHRLARAPHRVRGERSGGRAQGSPSGGRGRARRHGRPVAGRGGVRRPPRLAARRGPLGRPVPDGHRFHERLGSAARSVVYAAGAAGTVGFLLGHEGASTDQQSKTYTARAMAEPGGRWLVLAVAAGFLVWGGA